ncbi:hypothetical protein [Sporosarcina ureae]|uniref:Uncharacterized protein n=1 Tax=Sporosarcina ureae TaxID=1571 RepID=A0ABM6JTY3_SPOUR|nr:hypothetical protein [Sporosarcina ureae]ARF13612.1 hypothetical protein SporoS204_05215 [Sporosarcina ureae]
MFDNPDLIQASTQLAKYLTQKGAAAVREKMSISKEKDTDKERINVLEEIIQDLIDDKNDLIQIAQVYDEQLVAQKISEDDIEYITTNIIPLFEKLLPNTEENTDKGTEGDAEDKKNELEIFKPLLSKETFNILQLLGFNYKQAIGEPLTQLVNSMIDSQKTVSKDENLENQRISYEYETQLLKMVNDKEAFKRYQRVMNKE